LRPESAVTPAAGTEPIAVGPPITPAEDPVGGVARPVARSIGPGGLRDLDVQLEDGPRATAGLAVPTRVRAERVASEGERETPLSPLAAPDLDAADSLTSPRSRPAAARRRRPAPGPRVKHVPDERSAAPRILPLDRDAEASPPAREHAIRTG